MLKGDLALRSLVRLHRRFHALPRARPDLEFPHRPQYPDTRVSAARIAFWIFGSTFDRPIAFRDLVSHISAWREDKPAAEVCGPVPHPKSIKRPRRRWPTSRDRWFESISLQQRVCELPVPANKQR